MGSISLTPFFFFNKTATTEIYTLSLHDALPILAALRLALPFYWHRNLATISPPQKSIAVLPFENLSKDRSEEHTSELQSPVHLVCRLLLEKKKITNPDKRYSETNDAELSRQLLS